MLWAATASPSHCHDLWLLKEARFLKLRNVAARTNFYVSPPRWVSDLLEFGRWWLALRVRLSAGGAGLYVSWVCRRARVACNSFAAVPCGGRGWPAIRVRLSLAAARGLQLVCGCRAAAKWLGGPASCGAPSPSSLRGSLHFLPVNSLRCVFVGCGVAFWS